MSRVTWIECRLDDATVGASLSGFSSEVEAEARLKQEQAERLSTGRCERCFEETDEILTLSAGEAVCEGCLDAEVAEDLDEPEPV
jgi:hypothetical protein